MDQYKKLRPLSFLSFVFPLLLTALSDNSVPPYEIGCSDSTNQANQQYAQSLNATLSTLNDASSTAYFSNATSGFGPAKAYAAFLCRYDIPLTTCHDCVRNSTATIESSSPAACTDGEISYGLCTLHFANRSIASRLDSTLSSYWCLPPAPNGPLMEAPPVEAAAAGLIDKATANASRNYYFATGEQADERNRTMYGMVQCAPDIAAAECRQCLNLTLRNGLMGCGLSVGVYAYTGSCSVTYSLYAFYKTSSNSSVTPQPLTSRLLPASSSLKLGPDIFISTAVWIVLLLVMEMTQG